ncbi:ankyrin repeat domain-containing protein [Chitinophaga sp. 22321]|uniref:Ankyrin repeat domain-containing protein n=1 Tax=Chitinophaga hostae TaxID=2831022 RepID=A0ABS5IVJ1_9BACT|nr:ankyrin repeat domain-containing protein [Chitinophaga hostae]MBS0026977.1 ankyrin repeat domain-containing protein [Chitinophaga hostae]
MRLILLLGMFGLMSPACAQKNREVVIRNNTIFKAAANNDTAGIKAALGDAALLEAKDERGRTPLMVTTYHHHTEAARVLIAAGANVNAQDKQLNSPFLYAGAEGYADILKMCMGAGADYTVFNRYGGSALIPAAERAHIEVIALLLADKTFPVNHINRLGWTALLEAVILGRGGTAHQQVVKMLIAGGADVNIADKDGVTSLQHAKNSNYSEIIKMLQEAGAK